MAGFYGEYKCACDAKGRLFVPAKLRENFGEEKNVILVRSLDPCVSVYPEENWKVFEEKIAAMPSTDARKIQRFFYSSMQDALLDAQGRLQLPQTLRDYAGVLKNIIVLGCRDHVEIWDEASYIAYAAETRTEEIEEILRRNGL